MKRLSVLFVSMSVAVAATTSAPAQQLYESPDNAFYRYDANDGEGVAGPGNHRTVFDSLDGTWSHGSSPDRWDRMEVGAGSPGGVTVAGGTIKIQDPGDPRDHGIEDPSNRRIILHHDLSADGARATLLDDGVTLYFRARVPSTGDDIYPAGGGARIPYPPEGDGYVIHGGGWGGPLSIYQSSSGVVSFGLTTAFDSDSSGGVITEAGLVTNNLNGSVPTGNVEQESSGARRGTINFMALDTLQWHDYYITIQRGGAGTHRATLYLDGDLTPAVEWDVTAGASTFHRDITYVALAMGSTPQSGSIEIDFLEVAPGVAPPRLACSSEGDTHCPVDGLAVTQVDGVPGEAGTYRAEVSGATDNSGDPILYTFTIVSDGRDPKVIGPQPANAVEFRLETGTHVVTAAVDDSSICPDETVDATCGPVDLTVVVVEPEGPIFKRGDCNGDGEVNISDATCALEWLFAEAPAPGCLAALNTNGDDDVNIADPVSLLGFLFGGGRAPAAPFLGCGRSQLEADATLGCVRGCQ